MDHLTWPWVLCVSMMCFCGVVDDLGVIKWVTDLTLGVVCFCGVIKWITWPDLGCCVFQRVSPPCSVGPASRRARTCPRRPCSTSPSSAPPTASCRTLTAPPSDGRRTPWCLARNWWRPTPILGTRRMPHPSPRCLRQASTSPVASRPTWSWAVRSVAMGSTAATRPTRTSPRAPPSLARPPCAPTSALRTLACPPSGALMMAPGVWGPPAAVPPGSASWPPRSVTGSRTCCLQPSMDMLQHLLPQACTPQGTLWRWGGVGLGWVGGRGVQALPVGLCVRVSLRFACCVGLCVCGSLSVSPTVADTLVPMTRWCVCVCVCVCVRARTCRSVSFICCQRPVPSPHDLVVCVCGLSAPPVVADAWVHRTGWFVCVDLSVSSVVADTWPGGLCVWVFQFHLLWFTP